MRKKRVVVIGMHLMVPLSSIQNGIARVYLLPFFLRLAMKRKAVWNEKSWIRQAQKEQKWQLWHFHNFKYWNIFSSLFLLNMTQKGFGKYSWFSMYMVLFHTYMCVTQEIFMLLLITLDSRCTWCYFIRLCVLLKRDFCYSWLLLILDVHGVISYVNVCYSRKISVILTIKHTSANNTVSNRGVTICVTW